MRRLAALVAMLAFSTKAGRPADWLNYGGDAQRSGWQKHETILSAKTVKGLRLLWKWKFDNAAQGRNSLTAPVILGRIITHRGIRELVFVAGSSNNVYAVDADLGKLFWKRHLDSAISDRKWIWPCGSGLTAAPALAPDPAARSSDDADEDDAPTPMRPLYVLSSDGRLH